MELKNIKQALREVENMQNKFKTLEKCGALISDVGKTVNALSDFLKNVVNMLGVEEEKPQDIVSKKTKKFSWVNFILEGLRKQGPSAPKDFIKRFSECEDGKNINQKERIKANNLIYTTIHNLEKRGKIKKENGALVLVDEN